MEIYFTKDAAAELNANKAINAIIDDTVNLSLECAKFENKKFLPMSLADTSLHSEISRRCATERRPSNDYSSFLQNQSTRALGGPLFMLGRPCVYDAFVHGSWSFTSINK